MSWNRSGRSGFSVPHGYEKTKIEPRYFGNKSTKTSELSHKVSVTTRRMPDGRTQVFRNGVYYYTSTDPSQERPIPICGKPHKAIGFI